MNPKSTIFFITIAIIFFFTQTISSTITISYSQHCNSLAPEATPTQKIFTRFPFLEPMTSHFTGGETILGHGSSSQTAILLKATRNLFKTNVTDTYKIQAHLTFFPINYSELNRTDRYDLVFFLDGFWSVSTNTLCMVGSARFSKEGKPLRLDVVLKLKMARFITLKTSLVSGILESLASRDDSDYFDPIRMIGFPQVASFKYNYTLVSNNNCSKNNNNIQKDSETSMQLIDMCSRFRSRIRTYRLEYRSTCSDEKNCNPFGDDGLFLPSFVALNGIQCSYADKKLRFLVEFQDRRYTENSQSFNPNITLIGEGTWNGTKDEICIVACRILNQNDPGRAHVGDCSFRLTLWYPAVRSIKNTHTTEGQIWTTKKVNDIGYFETVKFLSFDHSLENYGSKYEFTEMENVKRVCPTEKHADGKGGVYPLGYGYNKDMTFDISVKHDNVPSTGFAVPIFVGNRVYHSGSVDFNQQQAAQPPATTRSTTTSNSPLTISYEIGFTMNSTSESGISSLKLLSINNGRVDISAEGFYDDQTGRVCMIGCRKLNLFAKNSINASFDCEIMVRFQLPRTNGDGGGFMKGSIESLREKTDALYFERLNVLSLTYTETASKKSLWRINLEVIMVLISDTFSCIFIALLLFHVKKRPEMVPSISVLMMLILASGHMVPLVLNFEAMFSKTRIQNDISVRTTDGWLEMNEIVVRTVTMVSFILQFHLLHLTWTAKLRNGDGNGNGNGNRKNPWIAEIQTFVIGLLIYIIGGSISLLVNWRNSNYIFPSQGSIWGDLRSYAGLTLDGFLLPQIILNILQISKGNALARSFYLGTTFIRLLPHGYDLYRGPNNISHQFDRLYIYANPGADFYSPSWDIVICCGGIVFAVIVFLQQRFGGRFMFPKIFQETASNE